MDNKAVAYTRVSSLSQEKGFSLEQQQKNILEYGKNNNIEIIGFFSDSSSGTTKNKGLNECLAFLSDKKANTLIICSIDRLFRSVLHFSSTLEHFRKEKINLISLTEQLNIFSPSGALIVTILSSISEFEAKMIKNRVCSGKIAKKELFKSEDSNMKLYLGGAIPYGYKVLKITQNYKNFKILVLNEDEQQVILNIKLKFKEGKSLQQIADLLNSDNIPTRNNKKWSKTQVWRIVKALKDE